VAKSVNIEEIRVKVEGVAKLGKLSSTFGKLNKNIGLTPVELNKAIKSITAYDRRGERSVNTFNRQIAALKQLRENVGIGSAAYNKLGKEIDNLSAKYDELMGKQQKSGGFFKDLRAGAKVGGKTALGASIGRFLPAGAQAGAAAGAGIGLTVDAGMAIAKYAASAAEYSAQIQKLEIALRGVTKSDDDFQYGLEVIRKTSLELNVPLAASTKQFTQLAASVLGAGGTIEQAETVFVGVAAAIKATGGNAEDVSSAIRAMTQIFGKGKVSAEELQGQLGERLAGAVVKFAEANGSSLQQLQKDLRDGTVGLDQVIKFAEKLNLDFKDIALEIADSSADAGERLRVISTIFKREIGDAVQPIGAAFQHSFAEMTKGILECEGAMLVLKGTLRIIGSFLFATIELVRFLTRTLVDMGKIMWYIVTLQWDKVGDVINKGLEDTSEQALKNWKRLKGMYTDPPTGEGGEGGEGGESDWDVGGEGASSPLKQFAQSAFDIAKQTEEIFVKAFKGMEDALVKFVETGKLNFKDLAKSIMSDLTRMFIRYQIVKPLFKAIFPNIKLENAKGNVFNDGNLVPSAKGNVFASNKIVPFAYGGIVRKPTLFPFKDGTGLMGEAGPEAIMPLKRGANGKLGVQASGGVGNVVVNVDASGSNVTGDEQQSAELGKLLGAAVQEELMKQKRPGGLLS